MSENFPKKNRTTKVQPLFSISKALTASVSRSVVQYSSAKSQISQMISCGIILIVLYFLADIFVFIPSSCLAAVMITATAPMFDPAVWKVGEIQQNTLV